MRNTTLTLPPDPVLDDFQKILKTQRSPSARVDGRPNRDERRIMATMIAKLAPAKSQSLMSLYLSHLVCSVGD
jgi:hypothetical protein